MNLAINGYIGSYYILGCFREHLHQEDVDRDAPNFNQMPLLITQKAIPILEQMKTENKSEKFKNGPKNNGSKPKYLRTFQDKGVASRYIGWMDQRNLHGNEPHAIDQNHALGGSILLFMAKNALSAQMMGLLRRFEGQVRAAGQRNWRWVREVWQQVWSVDVPKMALVYG